MKEGTYSPRINEAEEQKGGHAKFKKRRNKIKKRQTRTKELKFIFQQKVEKQLSDIFLTALHQQFDHRLNSGMMFNIARSGSIRSVPTLISPPSRWNRAMNSLLSTNPETRSASLSSSKWTFKTTLPPSSDPFLNPDSLHKAFSIFVQLKQKFSKSSG